VELVELEDWAVVAEGRSRRRATTPANQTTGRGMSERAGEGLGARGGEQRGARGGHRRTPESDGGRATNPPPNTRACRTS